MARAGLTLIWHTWLIFPALLLTACNSSTSAPPDRAAAGITVIPPLSGEAATNQLQLVERLRHIPKKSPFMARAFTNASRGQIRYLLFKPKDYQTNHSYPLVLSLHGGAPRRQFEHLLEPYLPGLAYGLGRLVCDETQNAHPSFVVAPWSNNESWEGKNQQLVMNLLQSLQQEFRIDSKRIYVTGQSMGGFGAWSFITAHPDYFAAAVPICGGGEPSAVRKPWSTPVWAFHGTGDNVVPMEYTRRMIAAVRKAGGEPLYWEYDAADHAKTAERAYCEPELISWLFAQSRR
jgi:predicted peptidase